MPPNPEVRREYTAWLAKSAEDLRAARIDMDADPPLAADALFHCQQACEKSIKALLVYLQIPFRRTHDLGELGSVVVTRIPRLEKPLSAIAHFSAYSVEFRYPGDSPEPTVAECHQVIQGATTFNQLIRDEIEALGREPET